MKNKKSNLLLIHNKGTLANKVLKGLVDYFEVKTFCVVRDMALDSICEQISEIFKSQELNLIVYISGETRNKSNMKKLNLELPAFISFLCDSAKIPLVYLSSLSIYGIPNKKFIFTNSQKSPFNLYGKTKLEFDNLLKNSFSNLKYCAIAPGTIINPYSKKSNLIRNGIKLLSSKPLIWILKYISPAGNLACVHIDDLVVCIVKECLEIKIVNDDQIYNCIKNCSRKIKIHDLLTNIIGVKPFFNLKYISIDLINLIFLFFPKNFRMKLLVYLIDIEYFNNYNFLNERPISDYF